MTNTYEPYIGMPIYLNAYDVQISEVPDEMISAEMWPQDMLSELKESPRNMRPGNMMPGNMAPIEMQPQAGAPPMTSPGNRQPSMTAPETTRPDNENPTIERPSTQRPRPGYGNYGSNQPGDCDMICDNDFCNWPLGMAYVPMQPWEEPYSPEQGMRAGTIFPSLDLPFKGGQKR